MLKNIKIGITEYGDAGIDYRWESKLATVDGAILITKNINPLFRKKVLEHLRETPIIIHCTCTGWGNTAIEPHVPGYKAQLLNLKFLLEAGFPAGNIVLRIDPVFPTEQGLEKVREVLTFFHSLELPEKEIRYRMSIVDEYPHVRDRYSEAGIKPIYKGKFGPSGEQIKAVAKVFSEFPYIFATCAEDTLAKVAPDTFISKGCCSIEDLQIMGLAEKAKDMFENPQKRAGCHCLSCKTELLKPRIECSHKCMYCFWKY